MNWIDHSQEVLWVSVGERAAKSSAFKAGGLKKKSMYFFGHYSQRFRPQSCVLNHREIKSIYDFYYKNCTFSCLELWLSDRIVFLMEIFSKCLKTIPLIETVRLEAKLCQRPKKALKEENMEWILT